MYTEIDISKTYHSPELLDFRDMSDIFVTQNAKVYTYYNFTILDKDFLCIFERNECFLVLLWLILIVLLY